MYMCVNDLNTMILCATIRFMQLRQGSPNYGPRATSGPPNKSMCGGLEKLIIVPLVSLTYSKLELLTGIAQTESISSLDSVTHIC